MGLLGGLNYGPGGKPKPQNKTEEDGNIVTNFLGDVVDTVKGLGSLVWAGVSDVGKGLADLVDPILPGDWDFDYKTDDIFVNATGWDPLDPQRSSQTRSAIGQDLAYRYGPLFQGDIGKFLDRAEDHPGLLALDVLSAGSGIGKLAQTAGKSALVSRAGEVGRVGEIATTALDLAKAAGRKGIPGAIKGGLDELVAAGDDLGFLGETARRILPGSEKTLLWEGGKPELVETTGHINPLRRGLGAPLRKLTREPIDDLVKESNRLTGLVKDGTATFGEAQEASRLAAVVDVAKQAGVTTAFKEGLPSNTLLRKATNKLVGEMYTGNLRHRAEDMAAVSEPLKALDADDLARAPYSFQNLDAPETSLSPEAAGSGGGLAVATDTRPLATLRQADPLQTYESLGRGPLETTISERVSAAAKPTADHLLELRSRAAGGDVTPELGREIALTERALRATLEPAFMEAEEKLGRVVTPLERAKELERLAVQERWTNPMITSGMWSPAQLHERAFLALRHRMGAKWDRTAKTITGGPDVLDVDDALAVAGDTAPIYFPHVDNRRIRPLDFTTSRASVGSKRYAKAGHEQRNTMYLLDKDLWLKDPMEAYRRRAARAVRWEETADFAETVAGRFGRPIHHTDELTPGEAVWAPEGIRQHVSTRATLYDEADDLMSRGLSRDEALAEALKNVVAHNADEMEAAAAKGFQMYAIPKVVADQIEAHVKLRGPRGIRLFWDSPINLWRSMVLLGSPRWIVNNVLGDAVFLKMQGARFRDVWATIGKRNEELLRQIDGIDEVSHAGMYGDVGQYTEHLGSAANTRAGTFIQYLKGSKGVRGVRKIGDASSRTNALIEDAFRRASYIKALERQQIAAGVRKSVHFFERSKTRLRKMAEAGFTPKMVESALKEAEDFFGNYHGLGPFERQIVRRYAFPFWGFYKHTLKLSASFPGNFPGRANVLRGLSMATQELMAEMGPVPEWLEGALPLGAGQDGEDNFLMTRGANPLSFVQELADDPAQALMMATNPWAKVFLEQAQGRSALTGREFSDENTIQPFGSDQQFRIDPETGEALPVDKTAPGIFEHLLQQLPQYTLLKDALAGGATYDTASLLDLVGGNGVIRDPATGEPKYEESTLDSLLPFLGVNTTGYDLEGYQDRLSDEQKAALKAYQRRRGGGSTGGGLLGGLSY
jgi:hypothetical protein